MIKVFIKLVSATSVSKLIQLSFITMLIAKTTEASFTKYVLFLTYSELFSIFILHGSQSAILKSKLSANIGQSLGFALFCIATIYVLSAPVTFFLLSSDMLLNLIILTNSLALAVATLYRNALVSTKQYSVIQTTLVLGNLPLLLYVLPSIFVDLSIYLGLCTVIITNIFVIILSQVRVAICRPTVAYFSSITPFLSRNYMGVASRNVGIVSADKLFEVNSLAGFGAISKISEQFSQILNLFTIQLIPMMRDKIEAGQSVRDIIIKLLFGVFLVLFVSVLSIRLFYWNLQYFGVSHWIVNYEFIFHIMVLAVIVGFLKSNFAVWEYVDEKGLFLKLSFIEVIILIVSILSNFYFLNLFDELGLAISYLVVQVTALLIALVFFFKLTNR